MKCLNSWLRRNEVILNLYISRIRIVVCYRFGCDLQTGRLILYPETNAVVGPLLADRGGSHGWVHSSDCLLLVLSMDFCRFFPEPAPPADWSCWAFCWAYAFWSFFGCSTFCDAECEGDLIELFSSVVDALPTGFSGSLCSTLLDKFLSGTEFKTL